MSKKYLATGDFIYQNIDHFSDTNHMNKMSITNCGNYICGTAQNGKKYQCKTPCTLDSEWELINSPLNNSPQLPKSQFQPPQQQFQPPQQQFQPPQQQFQPPQQQFQTLPKTQFQPPQPPTIKDCKKKCDNDKSCVAYDLQKDQHKNFTCYLYN